MPGGKNKRAKRGGDAYKNAYENVTITPRHFSDDHQPGTPRCFFKDSYDVTVAVETNETNESSCSGTVVVHQHANGLCIVTVGETLLKDVKDVSFQVKEAPQSMSANDRRKRQSKMLRGGSPQDSQGLVTPTTCLALLTKQNGETLQIPAGVWGTVLELNSNVTAQLLKDDPLLDGYLAVIMPTGVFPPKKSQQDEGEPRKKAHVSKNDD